MAEGKAFLVALALAAATVAAVAAARRPPVEPSPEEPPVEVPLVGTPSPETTASVIISAVQSNPSATTIHVTTDDLDYYVDVPSTTQAAAISGMSYEEWLSCYGFGVCSPEEAVWTPPRGWTLYGDNKGNGYFQH